MPRHFLNHLIIPFALGIVIGGCATQPKSSSIYPNEVTAEQQVTHSYCYKFLYGDYASQADYQRALHWCKQGATAGVAQTQTLLAEMYFLGLGLDQNYQQALQWYLAAANKGHAHAQFMLYHFYSRGLGTPVNQNAALGWLNKAAMQGHAHASNVLIQDA